MSELLATTVVGFGLLALGAFIAGFYGTISYLEHKHRDK